MPNTTTVLVFDANQRSALAAVRSLGKHAEITIIAGDDTPEALAGQSRYCESYVQYPSPYDQPGDFIAWLQVFIKDNKVDMLFPVTEVSSQLILMYQSKFSQCIIPYADIKTVNALANKANLVRLAEQLDVPYPQTSHYSHGAELNPAQIDHYPVVLKPCVSRLWQEDHWLNTAVHIAHSEQEVRQLLSDKLYFSQHPFMLQAFVPGTGAGIFTVYNNGRPLTFFGHQRLREKPPSGGVSVLSQGAIPDQKLINHSQKILDKVQWHGVAMIEYRITPEGEPYLMEVNTRFWGSLQLAIDCGVDFPFMLYQLAMGKEPATVNEYRTQQRLRWLLGDLDRLYIMLKDKQHYTLKDKLKAIGEFFTPSGKSTRHEVNRWGDMKPARYELKTYLLNLLPNR